MKAFANRRRLAIVAYLKKNKEATVGDIAEEIDLSFRSTSKHLAILASADIVEREQRSSLAYYRLSVAQKSSAKHILNII